MPASTSAPSVTAVLTRGRTYCRRRRQHDPHAELRNIDRPGNFGRCQTDQQLAHRGGSGVLAMAIGPTLSTFFSGVLLSLALSHCVGAGMGGGIAVGTVGFLLSSIALGAFTWKRLPIYWDLRRTLVTLLVAAGGGVIAGLVGFSATMVVAFSRCS